MQNAEDYIFLSTGLPLRGYNYNAQIGSRYGLMNLELRYPLFAFLQAGPLPIGLQSLGGVMFFDMGSAWTHDRSFKAFTRTPGGSTVTHVENLKDVGCESCHGPSSQHLDKPAQQGLVARDTLVLSYQNGLGNAEILAEVLGWEHVLDARVIYGVWLPQPGHAEVTGSNRSACRR